MALAWNAVSAHKPRSLFIQSHHGLPAPLVVLGMHRSGTSILTRMLQVCGVYIGPSLDRNHEDIYCRGLNKALLARAGATWYEPEPYLAMRADPGFQREAGRWLEGALREGFAARYLGWRHRLLPPGVPFPWGWKDPRTCLTMDTWLEVFGEARVVHVTRHPLDVALSLKRREEQRRERGKAPCPPVVDLRHGLRLWETYVHGGRAYRRLGDRFHELKYEDLAADPGRELDAILRACQLDPPPSRRAEAIALMDPLRTGRYEDPRYADLRAEAACLPGAAELGYE